MTALPSSALWRAAKTCAKFTRVFVSKMALTRLFPRHSGKHIKHLNNHLARDIGLSPAELARYRHVWPSQSGDRPSI